MLRQKPRATQSRSAAASYGYKRQLYHKAAYRSKTVVISNSSWASQPITWPQDLSFKSMNNGDITLDASSDSGLPITYISSDPTVVAIVSSKLIIKGAGTAIVTAVQKAGASVDNRFFQSESASKMIEITS